MKYTENGESMWIINRVNNIFKGLFKPFSSMTEFRKRANFLMLGLLWLSYVLMVPADANPDLDKVVSGDVNIVESGNKLDVIQNSQKAIIDWRSFSVDVDQHTQFHQPNSSSVTLNRVTGVDPSNIMGQLSANGNIILINPNGVLFSASARVDVNSLIAATADIKNDDFLAGNMIFDQAGNPLAQIINNGEITATKSGYIGLIAPYVENNGIIRAKLGKVHLAAGDTFTLDMYGDGLFEVAVSDETVTKTVKNTGLIDADGGQIYITAAAGNDIANSLIDIQGELKAPAAEMRNGKIVIFAEGSNAVKDNIASNKGIRSGVSSVWVAADIDASSDLAGVSGGSVTIQGDNVGILDSTRITATSRTGSGGEVYVGGDYLGGSTNGSTVATAVSTYVGEDVVIDVSSIESGNGGRAIVWADDSTRFYGSILAKGGVLSGDGGFVEVSGKKYLDFRGIVDTSAAQGLIGTLLLDPGDIEICQFSGANCTAVVPALTGPTFDSGANAVSYVDIGDAVTAGTLLNLLETNNVIVQTNAGGAGPGGGDITVVDAISSTSANTLTLIAHDDIIIQDDISVRNLTLNFADNTGDVVINNGVNVTSNDGTGRLSIRGSILNGVGIGTIGVGDNTTASDINISAQSIAGLSNWGDIFFGDLNYRQNIFIGDATFNDKVEFRNRNAGPQAIVEGNLVVNDGATFWNDNITILGSSSISGGGELEFRMRGEGGSEVFSIATTGADYNLTTAELDRIQDGFDLIKVGVIGGNGITVVGAYDWKDRVEINQGLNSGTLTLLSGTHTFQDGAIIESFTLSGDVTLESSSNSLVLAVDNINNLNNTNLGANNLTIRSDGDVEILAQMTGTGNLSISGLTDSTTIGLGSGAGTLQLTTADLGFIDNTFNQLAIGSSTMTGNLTVGNATLVTDAILDTGTGNIVLNGDLTSQAITLNGPITLASNSSISSGTGSITINENVTGAGFDLLLSSTQALSLSNTISGVNDLSLFTDTGFTLNPGTTISGTLAIAPSTLSASMGVGDGQAGTLNVSNADLTSINGVASDFVFGRSTMTGDINVGANTWGGDVTFLNSGAGDIIINGAQNFGANDARLFSDDLVNIGSTITGTGNLYIAPTTLTTTMAIGDGQVGDFNISDASISNINPGFTGVTFGSSTHTGDMNIGANTWNSNVSFINTGLTADIVINGAQNFGSNNATFANDGNLTISNTLTGSGTLTMTRSTAGTYTLGLSAGEISNITDGWSAINIGDNTNVNTLNISSASLGWQDAVNFNANNSILASANISGTGDASFAFNSTTTNFGYIGFLGSTGSSTSINSPGDVTFSNTLNLLTDSTQAAPINITSGGNIIVNGALNSSVFGAPTNDTVTFNSVGDISFNNAVNITDFDNFVIANANNVTATSTFNADNFTQTAGTGVTNINTLTATGDIDINSQGILGTYTGVNGNLNAGGGSINATTTFETLNIAGSSATLLAGNIGTVIAPASKSMADLISVNGTPGVNFINNGNFTFAGFLIGAFQSNNFSSLRLNSIFDNAIKDAEDSIPLLQENTFDNKVVHQEPEAEVIGGASCSGLFYSSEACQQKLNLHKMILIEEK